MVASGLTGSSQTLSVQGIGEPYGSFAGFEIVNNTLNRGGILPATTPLSIAAGATLDLGGGSQQLASLSNYGGGGGSIINSNSAASVLTLSPTGGSTTFSGAIQGGGTLGTIGLVINGSGTQVLGGSNSYTGATTIIQGKLVVDGWLTNSTVSVSGGTLGGTGYLSSGTVNAGGTLAPGDPLGVLHLSGNLVLAASGTMDFDLDGVSTDDEILMPSGSLTFSGQQFSNFGFAWTTGFGPGTYTLVNAKSISGLGSNLSGSIDGLPATLSVSNNNLMLTVVPEPSTSALLAAGILGLIVWVWRRRWLAAQAASSEAPTTLSFPSSSSRIEATRRAAMHFPALNAEPITTGSATSRASVRSSAAPARVVSAYRRPVARSEDSQRETGTAHRSWLGLVSLERSPWRVLHVGVDDR